MSVANEKQKGDTRKNPILDILVASVKRYTFMDTEA